MGARQGPGRLTAYFDSSAAAKLFRADADAEAESEALRDEMSR